MISIELAIALRDAGVEWHPRAGDRFAIPQPELVDQVFTLSEMTIEARDYPTGTLLRFNGTTEWALDSVQKEDTIWLPLEHQLRELLGGTFVALTSQVADPAGPAHPATPWTVTIRTPAGGTQEFAAAEPADAYAGAVLALVSEATGRDAAGGNASRGLATGAPGPR